MKNKYHREFVLRQASFIADLSQNNEPTISYLKNVYVKEQAIIDYQFRASGTGYVSCVFKYKDCNNYYTFEMGGGDNVDARFFEIRKKQDGHFTSIKKFSTQKEIEYLPFFGYETNTWYAVSIEIKYNNIKVFVSILGITAKMIVFNLDDNTLPFGYVGFGTYGTPGIFSEIFVRPFPIPYGMLYYN